MWDRDLKLIDNLGVKVYRFSLSWARLLPKGRVDLGVNAKGIEYYNKIINGLLDKNIIPFVTLYHWDLPSELQTSMGGWLNPEIAQIFGEYADFVFATFGDRVKHWITLNEPNVFADHGYHLGIMAPGIRGKQWIARHHTLLAHAEAYRIYDQKYRAQQQGIIGITLHSGWAEPRTKSERVQKHLLV